MTKISLPVSKGYMFFPLDKIIRFEACLQKTYLFLNGFPEPVIINCGIGKLEEISEIKEIFFRCHKSHLVNIKHIIDFKTRIRTLKMPDAEIPISRSKASYFRKVYCEIRNNCHFQGTFE
ncbi:MAG: LytTR family transcriptional regulator DNA-binding domain-containing protein [Bacteroidota bacterium]